jgi:hypothetical protein
MHWFDDFAKAAAGNRPSRSAVLSGLASMVAGAAVAPLAGPMNAAFARPRSHPSTLVPGGARIVPGIVPRHRARRKTTTERGPCSTTTGQTNSLTFSASASSLRLTIRHDFSLADPSRRSASAFSGTTVVDITDGGASLVHLETRFNSLHASAPLDATFTFRYGSNLRGISSAVLTARNGTVTGTVDGRKLKSFAVTGGAPSDVRLSDNRPLALEADARLREAMPELAAAVRSGLSTCASPSSLHRARDQRIAGTNGALLDDGRAIRPFEVADGSDQSVGAQNCATFGEVETTNCYNAFTNAGLALSGCIAGALVGSWLCPPCAAYAILGCYTTWGAVMAAMYLQGGACNQVPCGGWNGGPKSCDFGDICCGQYDCCPSSDICTSMGFCCVPSAPLACGTNEDNGFCCPSDTVCGQNQQCVGCPQGQVSHNGQCCNLLCGNECCQSAEATCDQATGKCVYPNFGTPAPKPPRIRIDRCARFSGLVTCQAANWDNTTVDICCAPGLNCCAGKCCPPGQTCGGSQANFGCGRWIR